MAHEQAFALTYRHTAKLRNLINHRTSDHRGHMRLIPKGVLLCVTSVMSGIDIASIGSVNAMEIGISVHVAIRPLQIQSYQQIGSRKRDHTKSRDSNSCLFPKTAVRLPNICKNVKFMLYQNKIPIDSIESTNQNYEKTSQLS